MQKRIRDLTDEDLEKIGFEDISISDGDNKWFGKVIELLNTKVSVPDILTKEEKKYLENIFEGCRYKIRGICKSRLNEVDEYITIYYYYNKDYHDYIKLFPFKKGTRFAGMKLDCTYSLNELGYFEEI